MALKWMIVLVPALVAGCASETRPGRIANYQSEGNLEARDVGCLAPEKLQNTYTAADLYGSATMCAKRNELDAAVMSNALAGAYARYDAYRVQDPSARQAHGMLRQNLADALSEAQRNALNTRITQVTNDPQGQAALCARIRAIGAPDYYPKYMIQHGLGAFLRGRDKQQDLKPDFNGAAAWEKALDTWLHCPELAREG